MQIVVLYLYWKNNMRLLRMKILININDVVNVHQTNF